MYEIDMITNIYIYIFLSGSSKTDEYKVDEGEEA